MSGETIYLGPDRPALLTNAERKFDTSILTGNFQNLAVVEALIARRKRLARSPLADLTPREMDVLREMAEGRTNAAIAARLSVSESAVEKHGNAIFSKLGLSEEKQVHRRVAAVLAFLRASCWLRPRLAVVCCASPRMRPGISSCSLRRPLRVSQ